jgi:hypothetical protein
MKTYDIWGSAENSIDAFNSRSSYTNRSNSYENLLDYNNKKVQIKRERKGKGETAQ